VTQEEYDAHLQQLQDEGATSELPLLGGEFASTPAGLESGDESEEGAE
jgi:cytochrome c oxidase subunit 2